MDYSTIPDSKKKQMIEQQYCVEKKSFQQIAVLMNTYTNKIRRDAQKFQILIRTKSEAQKNALSTGVHKHPTKGTVRSEDTKNKIGQAVLKNWEDMSPEELERRQNQAKAQWESLSEDQKSNLINMANKAVRSSSKTGSKLEKFIFNKLIQEGYEATFHQEQTLLNTKLQIDIFLPKLNTAIEIDGPSHFLPVWGEKALQRNIKYDNKKTGLLLGKGCLLIRVKQFKDYSPTRAALVCDQLLVHLREIKNNLKNITNKLIEIGD